MRMGWREGWGTRPLAVAISGRRLVQLALLLLPGVLSSCTSVKDDDLVGTWTMTGDSRRFLPAELLNVSPQFTLNPDGTFTAVDLLEFDLHDDGSRRVGSVTWVNVARSGRGTWSIQPMNGRDQVFLRFEGSIGAQLSISDWSLNGPGSPTTLYYFRGDPDSVQRIQFTRQR